MNTIFRNVTRLNIVAIPAALVTILLFFIMQSLIAFNGNLPQPVPYKVSTSISIPDEPIIIKTVTPRPPEPVEVVPPPEAPRDGDEPIDGPGYGSTIKTPPVELTRFNDSFEVSEGNALALVQLQPTYPQRALERGIEGYVVLEFSISPNGTVVDPKVLLSQPAGVFDRAALKAIQRWKYQPKILNGKEVEMRGIQKKMVFSIKD